MTLMEMAARIAAKLETALEVYAQKTRAERDNQLLYRDTMELDIKERIHRMAAMRIIPSDYLGPRQTYLANLAKHTQTLPQQTMAELKKQSWRDKKTKPHQKKPYEKPLTHHMSIPEQPATPVEEVPEAPKDEATP